MKPIIASLTVTAPVANAVSASQQPLAAGNLLIDGANATGGVATFTVAYAVSVTSDDDDSVNTFTITGTDASGNVITETITGPDTTTVYTTSVFKTVTQVAISGGAVGNITVGFGSFGATTALPLDYNGRPEVAVQVVIDDSTGTPTWTVQQTYDNPQTTLYPTWFDHPSADMVAETVSRQGSYAYAPLAVRLKITSSTGGATITVVQYGLQE